MSFIQQNIPYLLDLIENRLLGVKNHKVGFVETDFKEMDRRDFYGLLKFIKEKGLIRSIRIVESDDTFKFKNGTELTYMECPEQYPGLFVVSVDKDFLNLKEKLLKKINYVSEGNKKIYTSILQIQGKDIVIPPNTTWDDVTIQFINKNGIDLIIQNESLGQLTNEELGFYKGKKNKQPNQEWRFLLALSLFQNRVLSKNTTLDIPVVYPTIDVMIKELNTTKDTIFHIKSSLDKKLQKKISIHDTAFYPYDQNNYYKTKFTLLPESGLGKLYDDDEDLKGDNVEYNDEINSNVNHGRKKNTQEFEKI